MGFVIFIMFVLIVCCVVFASISQENKTKTINAKIWLYDLNHIDGIKMFMRKLKMHDVGNNHHVGILKTLVKSEDFAFKEYVIKNINYFIKYNILTLPAHIGEILEPMVFGGYCDGYMIVKAKGIDSIMNSDYVCPWHIRNFNDVIVSDQKFSMVGRVRDNFIAVAWDEHKKCGIFDFRRLEWLVPPHFDDIDATFTHYINNSYVTNFIPVRTGSLFVVFDLITKKVVPKNVTPDDLYGNVFSNVGNITVVNKREISVKLSNYDTEYELNCMTGTITKITNDEN